MKFLNIFRHTSTDNPTITLTFINDQLTITQQKSPDNPTTLELTKNTIYQGIIFKPFELTVKISSYLKSNKLKNPTAQIFLPPTITELTEMLPFFVLQYTLVLAKTGIQITQITGTNQATNLLALLHQTATHTTKSWFIITIITLSALGTNIWMKQQEAITDNLICLTRATICKQTNTDYEQQYKKTNELKATIKQLKEKHVTTQEILKKKYNPSKTLEALANYTPESIWLTTVTLKKTSMKTTTQKPTTKQLKKQHELTIIGTSFDTATISQFLKNLEKQNTGIQHPTIVNVRKEKQAKSTNNQTLYNFIIGGRISNAFDHYHVAPSSHHANCHHENHHRAI